MLKLVQISQPKKIPQNRFAENLRKCNEMKKMLMHELHELDKYHVYADIILHKENITQLKTMTIEEKREYFKNKMRESRKRQFDRIGNDEIKRINRDAKRKALGIKVDESGTIIKHRKVPKDDPVKMKEYERLRKREQRAREKKKL